MRISIKTLSLALQLCRRKRSGLRPLAFAPHPLSKERATRLPLPCTTDAGTSVSLPPAARAGATAVELRWLALAGCQHSGEVELSLTGTRPTELVRGLLGGGPLAKTKARTLLGVVAGDSVDPGEGSGAAPACQPGVQQGRGCG